MGTVFRSTIVLLTLCSAVAPGCGGDPKSSDRQPRAAGVLPCTAEDEPTNFSAYHVGREFEGLPLTGHDRRCTQAPPGAPPQARLNLVEYHYGDCEPPRGEGGCALPLSVQSWPRCERGFSPYSSREFTIRGVPARFQGGGLALLTGDSLVSIFGDDRDRVLRAARALVKAPARPSEPVSDEQKSGPLPPAKPAASGCRTDPAP